MGVQNRADTDIKRFRAAVERFKHGYDVLPSPDFEFGDFQAEHAGHGLHLLHFQHGGGIIDIGQNRQTAQPRENLSLPARSGAWSDSPVTLPDGRARLAIRPVPSGSLATNTIGITDVACFAATTAAPNVTIISTLSRTNSAAISATRSGRASAHRTSIAALRPSIQPSSRSRCTNAATHWPWIEGVLEPKNPIIGSLAGCCARVARGQAAAPPSSVMNSRRLLIRSPRRRGRSGSAEG